MNSEDEKCRYLEIEVAKNYLGDTGIDREKY